MMRGAVAGNPRETTLGDGAQFPLLGLGVWQIPDGRECVDAVRWALELGYRHVDTAQAYGNEESVGQGLRESGVPRDQVFITTKFNPTRTDPVAAVESSLERLGLERVDLYIIHSPPGGPTWAWPGMERARELGYARSIGVSNFDVAELREVLATASVAPVVNQLQFSPYEYRKGSSTRVARTGSCSRPTALSDTVATSAARRRHGSRSASGARRHRCCCAGASSVGYR
jgi:diketogulonate reductase-like aldo/keto reductase